MKSSLTAVIILFSVIITSCKVYKPAMLSVEKNPNSVLLKRMEIASKGNTASKTQNKITSQAYDYTIFERNLEGNWMDNSKERYGKIEFVLIEEVVPKRAYFWAALAGLTFGGSILLGLPYFYTQNYFIEYQLNIFDVNDRKIKSYNYKSNTPYAMALYYGKDVKSHKISVLHGIMAQISEDFVRDAVNINDELIDAIQ